MIKWLAGVSIAALLATPASAFEHRHVHARGHAAEQPKFYLLPGLEPFRAQVSSTVIVAGSTPVYGTCTNGFNLYNNNGIVGCQANGSGGGGGTVTSVSWTGGIVTVGTPTTTPAFTIAGTSGGIPYFASASTWASSALLGANLLMQGGGAGVAPSTFTLGGDCTFSTPNITCTAVNGKALTLGGPLITTGAGTTTLAFAAAGVTYTFPSVAATLGTASGPASSTNNDVAIFSGTGGQTLADGGKVLPAGAIVGTTDTQALTNKSISGSQITSDPSCAPGATGCYTTGQSMWYTDPLVTAPGTTSTVGVTNSYYCVPFQIKQTVVIKGAMIRVVTPSSGNNLEGAFYTDVVNTIGLHRPLTLIDYTTAFLTTSAGQVTATLNNTTDTLTGPGLVWFCLQKNDATATYAAVITTGSSIPALIGDSTSANIFNSSGTSITGVSVTGSAFGGANWVNFVNGTSWTAIVSTAGAPLVAIQVN